MTKLDPYPNGSVVAYELSKHQWANNCMGELEFEEGKLIVSLHSNIEN